MDRKLWKKITQILQNQNCCNTKKSQRNEELLQKYLFFILHQIFSDLSWNLIAWTEIFKKGQFWMNSLGVSKFLAEILFIRKSSAQEL